MTQSFVRSQDLAHENVFYWCFTDFISLIGALNFSHRYNLTIVIIIIIVMIFGLKEQSKTHESAKIQVTENTIAI